nr:GtrA family protein [uncultured Albidiferax sp.]
MWRQFLRFVNSGAIGTAVHYTLLWLLVNQWAVQPVWASTAGAVAGAATIYGLNYVWTFASDLPHRRTLPRFIAIALTSMLLNLAIMYALTKGLQLHYLLAQVVATGVCLGLNYLASRYWAFKPTTT